MADALSLAQIAEFYRQQMIQPQGRYFGHQFVPHNADQMAIPQPLPRDRNIFDPNETMNMLNAPGFRREAI